MTLLSQNDRDYRKILADVAVEVAGSAPTSFPDSISVEECGDPGRRGAECRDGRVSCAQRSGE